MKKSVIFGVGLSMFVLASCGGAEEEATEETNEEVTEEVVVEPVIYTVNTEASVINWTAYDLNNEVDQSGTVLALSGDLTVEDGGITSAALEVDMNSIASDGGMEKLDGHLKNEDFFDVNQYATTSFEFEKYEEGRIYGSASIVGTSYVIEAAAEVVEEGDGVTVTVSEFKLDFSVLPYMVEDAKAPVEEQHNPSVGFTATIVGNK
jgi:hypothetical protein